MPSTISHRRRSSAMHLRLPSSAPTKFHKFRDLPPELRCLIWEMALPGSRIVVLEQRTKEDDSTYLETGLRVDRLGFRADAPPPTILLVCHESYDIASKHYTQTFSNARQSSIAETYFDYKKDVLYLGPEYTGHNLDTRLYQERILHAVESELHWCELSQVENLAIWYDTFHRGEYGLTEFVCHVLTYFPKAKSVTIVNKKYVMPGFKDTYPNMHSEIKFLNDMSQTPGSDISIQGLPIPYSKSWISRSDFDVELFEEVIRALKRDIPTISYNIITTPHGEELLLQEAKDARAQKMWGS